MKQRLFVLLAALICATVTTWAYGCATASAVTSSAMPHQTPTAPTATSTSTAPSTRSARM